MAYMELQAGTEISLGTGMISSDVRGNRSVPEWAGDSPKPRDDTKALRDIYREIVRVQDMIADVDERLQAIETVLRTPWYRRLTDWLRSFF